VVYQYIRTAIVSGEFAPGSPLPEEALAQQLNTSRGTVREALKALAHGGLVDAQPHRGASVTQLTLRATWETASLRALLEPFAARLAVEAAGSDLGYQQAVRRAYERLRDVAESGDPVAFAQEDIAFHAEVYSRCGHGMLLDHLESLQVLARRLVLFRQIDSSDAAVSFVQHAPIMAAVEAGDPEGVERAVREHVVEGGQLLTARMAAHGENTDLQSERAAVAFSAWPTGSSSPAAST
jgi:DNA-binding GntR family transcriptional regulator